MPLPGGDNVLTSHVSHRLLVERHSAAGHSEHPSSGKQVRSWDGSRAQNRLWREGGGRSRVRERLLKQGRSWRHAAGLMDFLCGTGAVIVNRPQLLRREGTVVQTKESLRRRHSERHLLPAGGQDTLLLLHQALSPSWPGRPTKGHSAF